jgi:hypothetical protein
MSDRCSAGRCLGHPECDIPLAAGVVRLGPLFTALREFRSRFVGGRPVGCVVPFDAPSSSDRFGALKSATHLTGYQGRQPLVSRLYALQREFCSHLWVATVSAFCWPWAFSCQTTHDHRKLRGDRGYPYRDIKGDSPWLVRGLAYGIEWRRRSWSKPYGHCFQDLERTGTENSDDFPGTGCRSSVSGWSPLRCLTASARRDFC